MNDCAYWEGYGKMRAEDVPEGTRFDASELKSKRYAVAFGGPSDSVEPHGWGAPFRRVTDRKTGIVTFSRYRRVPPPRNQETE
jgi:hypothetical protein